MRTVAGWIVGVAVFAAVMLILEGRELGLVFEGASFMNFEGEETSGFTFYGTAVASLAFLLGLWSGLSVGTKNCRGGVSERDWVFFKAWFVWSIILVFFYALSQIAFRQFHGLGWLHFVIDILAALGIAWFCNQWRMIQLRDIEASEARRREQQKNLT